MDPVFNKFKEKLGSFKKAFSKTIDEKAVEVEPVIIEQVPESEESLEEEIEPVIEEETIEAALEEEIPEKGAVPEVISHDTDNPGAFKKSALVS